MSLKAYKAVMAASNPFHAIEMEIGKIAEALVSESTRNAEGSTNPEYTMKQAGRLQDIAHSLRGLMSDYHTRYGNE